MKKKSNAAMGVAIGMAAGVTLGAVGALGAMQMNSKTMKKAKKIISKNASKAVDTAENIISALPKMM